MLVTFVKGRAIAQAVSHRLPTAATQVPAQVRSWGFVVDKVILGQVFSQYFGFPCQFSFHRLFHIHRHLSSGTGTVGQLVADVQSGLSLAPLQKLKTIIKIYFVTGPCFCCSTKLFRALKTYEWAIVSTGKEITRNSRH
jgi:hypothetical protein